MTEASKKILKFNQEYKSIKIPLVIYANTEPFLEKTFSFANVPTKSFTSKISKHTSCAYTLFTYCLV